MSVLEELRAREPIFHRRELGTTRADFERITAEDFWEIGASGAVYTRDFVLDTLERRYSTAYEDDLVVTDFRCRALGNGLYQVNYRLVQEGDRVTLRTTLWRWIADEWVIVFHQGTVVASHSGLLSA